MTTKRTDIPKDIAAIVLFESDRTCCVCRKERQRVQIHHIDEDPANHSIENLAVLCFDCHWETQIRGGFDRKLDAQQVRLFRNDWVNYVKEKRKGSGTGCPLPIPVPEKREYIEYEVVQNTIEYEVVQNTVVSYSHSEVLKRAGIFVAILALVVVLLISVGALAIAQRELFYTYLSIPVLFLLAYGVNSYRLFFRVFFLPKSEGTDRYTDGKYVHKGMDGNYTFYEKEAACNQPKCSGRVRIVPAPPRERHTHMLSSVGAH